MMEPAGLMEIAALGRPFGLGMLYDCRTDKLIPGMTLWDEEDLLKHIRDRPQNYNNFEMVASESIEDKSSALNVDASLKASFLGGLVEVGGSAQYLKDNKTSKNQARVTMNYKATTKVQELSMNHLGKVKYKCVFDQGLATHVVTAILYGAQAFFVFDYELSEKEDNQDIQGNLKITMKKILGLAIEGQGSLQMEEKEKEKVEKLSCRFFGDFRLQKTLTTFHDSIEVYQSLPTLLGANGENAVPVKVWLLPLTSLDSSAAKLVRQISIGVVQEAQKILENFNELEMRCNDALRTTAQQFPQIDGKIKQFKEMCSEFKLGFQQTLAEKLPSIRGGGEEEAGLLEILKKRHSSPFNNRNLDQWLTCKEREVYTLKSFIKKMKNTKIISSETDLYRETMSVEHVVCFIFTSLGSDEPYLSALSNYLRGTSPGGQDLQSHDVQKEQWYASREVMEEMRKKVKLFCDFAEANKENQNIKFLAANLTDETHKGSTIYLYEDSFTVSENFEPPSKSEAVMAGDINHNSVTLKVSPPKFGADSVTSYSVEFSVRGEYEWKKKTETKPGEVTVSDLKPNTEYVFRCRAVTPLGVGPASDPSDPIKTSPCSPPGELHAKPNSREISVRWKRPAEVGQDVQISGYMLEYAETTNEVAEDLQWKQMMTTEERKIISGLQPETQYAVRVRCVCGEAGTSRESITVRVCTKRFRRPADILADSGKEKRKKLKKQSGPLDVYAVPLKNKDISIKGCRSFSFGEESSKPNRTIMVLGATGAGKSTLINGMINYILAVEWEDSCRFLLVDEDQSRSQAHSQTSEVTVYKLYHQEGFQIDYTLTIVDTPGFGDTRGIEKDGEITEQIRNLFTDRSGVSEIDAVCFVAQAFLARLTPTQRYVFDSVLSMFGKDVAENIQILVTFADGQKPPVLEAIKESGVPCPKDEHGSPAHFKFNNSVLFADSKSSAGSSMAGDDSDEDENFDHMFWKMGTKSMKRFFAGLNLMKTKSLKLTQEVLRERKELEVSIEGLQMQVRLGLSKMEEIRETRKQLNDHEAEISRNEKFEIEVTVMKPFQEDISRTGNFINNCMQCNQTCHYPCSCSRANDKDKINCAAMIDGKCRVCPGKCVWSLHVIKNYRWIYKEVKEKRTVEELKEKYHRARGKKTTVQEQLDKLTAEYGNVQRDAVTLMQKSTKCLNRLKEIALRPNPLSTPELINLLIEGEKSEKKPGWKERTESLMKMKEQAEYMARVERGENLLHD